MNNFLSIVVFLFSLNSFSASNQLPPPPPDAPLPPGSPIDSSIVVFFFVAVIIGYLYSTNSNLIKKGSL